MNRRRIARLVLLMATALVLIVSHFSAVHSARPKRILLLGRDVSDAIGVDCAKAQSGYEPYSHRVNYFGAIVIPGTNPMTMSQ